MVSDSDIAIPHVKGDYLKGFEKAVLVNLDRGSFDAEELVPLYVKKSQAEEEQNG